MSEYPDPFAMQPSLLAQIEEAKTRGLSLARVVQDRETAQALGWSQNLVADNRDEAGNLVAQQAISQSELFKSWAAEDAEKAAIAREDYAMLSQGFNLLEAERKRQALLTWGERKGIQLERGISRLYQTFLGFGQQLYENAGNDDPISERSLNDPRARRYGFSGMAPSEEEVAANKARNEANAQELLAARQASVEAMPAPLLDPSFFEDIVEQGPQVGAQIVTATLGTLAAGPAGGFMASMGLMVPQIAGGQYARLRDEGVSPENAATASLLNAALQAPLESLGIGRALAPFWSKGWKAVVKATGVGALTEGATEFLQAFPEDFTYLLAHANERGDGEWLQQFIDRLGGTAKQGLYEGAIGAFFGLFGGAGRIGYEAAHAVRAGQFREQMRAVYQSFENTKVKQQAPDIAQGIMEYGGLGRDVYVDADQARTYYQADPTILEVLDVSEEQLNQAVALGQDLPVNLARITAYAKDSGQFDAVINMTRDVPYAETVAEINREGRDREQVERIIDTLKEYDAAENEVAAELARIETEIAEALSGADPAQKHLAVNRESVSVAARQNVQLIAAAMRRFYPDPAKRVEALKGLRGENPDNIATQMEAENERLRREFRKLPLAERNPLLGHIQRRLDLTSLRGLTDAATIKELQRKLPFLAKSKAKGGLAIDVLADELVTRGLLPEGSGASELLSYLQDVDSDGAVAKGTYWQAEEVQQQAEHAAKVHAIQSMPAQKVTPGAPLDKKAAENLALSFGKMENKRDHRVAELPVVTVGKILRNKGYDVSTIMADIPELYENAILGWSEEETLRDGHKLHNNIAAYHNYVNKFTGADGKEYYIRFTITERNAPAGKKEGPSFIHSTAISDVTIYENADTEARLRLDNPVVSSESAFVDKKLQHFFDSVKTPTGKTYAQELRGATTILPEGYIISLFSGANLSTLPHELGHIFENELRKIVASGAADASLTTDVAILDNWLSFLDNDENLRVEYDKWLKHQSYEGQDFNEFWPWDLEEMRDRAKREYFARGFEVYLMEGKAPSEGMRGVFERFKRWLLDIYKQAAGLGVELNDEVRGVFDRMLAAEVEVNEAADLNNLLPIPAGVLEDLGVSPTDRENINLLLDTAKERAAAEAVQARNEGRNKRIQQYRDEAKKELLKNPVYAARAELRKEGGYLNAASVIAEFGEDMVKELNRRLPGSVRKDGGRDLKVLAAELGFADAAEMVSQIVSVKSMGKRIDEIVRERMARHDSEVVDPAEHLLKAPETAQQMALLGHWLTNKLKQETQAVAVAQRAIEAAAAETLGKESMKRGTSPYRYLAAMRRALQRQNTALKNKDYPEALRANTQARLNLELSKQAMRLSETTGRVFKELKRFTGMAKTSPAARYAVNFLAAKHGLMRLDEAQAANKNMQTISDWYRDMEADGYPIVFDEALFGGEASDWRDMSVDEFMALTQEITTIITVERNQRHLLTAKGKMDFREAIDGAVRSMLAANKAKPVSRVGNKAGGFIKQGLQKVHAAHMKIEVLLRILDGKDLGENWELIYKPISDAENRRGQLAKEFEERLQEIVSVYSEQERRDMARKPEFEEAIGEAVTKEKRIMIALNMGNEGNLERMVNGNGLSHAEIQRLVAPLTKKDWDFVANIWALFEKYKPMAFDLHERVTGVRPSEVEARPFNIQTADNQFIRVPGGYFPVVYDQARMDPKLKEKIERSRMPAVASTKKGHLKERTAVGAGAPLKFELASINRAFADVISDMAFREALIDVGRVLRNKEYRAAVQSVAGEEMYRAMVDWLVDVAEVRKPSQVGEGLARWARSNVSVMSMGWKATTALAQPMGIAQSIDRLGATYVMQGVKEAYGGGIKGFKEKAAWVRSVSSFMDTRMETFDRDMNDALEDFNNVQLTPGTLLDAITPRKLKEFERWMKKTAFKPIAYMQFGVDLPTWLGAYDKGMKDFDGNHDKAKDYADHIVRITQGSGETLDLAKIQRGNEYLKMFTMFYSYFNTLYGLIALRANDVNMNMDQASAMRAATSFLLLVALPATFTEIMAGRGPDEDEEWWAWAAKEITMYPAMSVVGLRDVARFVDGQFGYDMSPAESAPESIFKLLRETLRVATDPEKFDLEKMGKLLLQAYGYTKGLPLKQVEISLFNIIHYLDGTAGDFELRDLVFPKPQSRR